MLAHLALLPWVICSPGLTLPAVGATHWAAGETAPTGAWTATITPRRACYLLLELEGRGAFADLDLRVRGEGWEQASASHHGQEVLLLPVVAGEELTLHVPPTQATARFRLGLTPLVIDSGLTPGGCVQGSLNEGARVQLYALAQRLPLTLRRDAGGVRPQLLVFDQNTDLLDRTRVSSDRSTLLPPAPLGGGLLALVRAPAATRYRLEAAKQAATLADRADARPLDRFLELLGRTPAQDRVLSALRRNPDYVRMRIYLEGYPSGLPLRLLVVPGLRAHGIERFGTYSRGTLAINPTIDAHQTNPQELVDTLIHELVHAILSLPRAPGFPLAPDVLDSSHDFRLRGLGGAPLKRGAHPEPYASYLEREYGPSASNPGEDYTDINAGAQRLISKVITANLARTGLGKKTLVFTNVEAREHLAAETK